MERNEIYSPYELFQVFDVVFLAAATQEAKLSELVIQRSFESLPDCFILADD
ncbi:MAG: hypothetical protein H6573_30030 [Lewinellaceae bacterium]|nr:hypothetical protein [Lewinellaceae bacterium]